MSETTGREIRERLCSTEGNDERENGTLRRESEVVLADEREDAPLEPDHSADEGIERDEERELARVRPQPEANGNLGHISADALVAPQFVIALGDINPSSSGTSFLSFERCPRESDGATGRGNNGLPEQFD